MDRRKTLQENQEATTLYNMSCKYTASNFASAELYVSTAILYVYSIWSPRGPEHSIPPGGPSRVKGSLLLIPPTKSIKPRCEDGEGPRGTSDQNRKGSTAAAMRLSFMDVWYVKSI